MNNSIVNNLFINTFSLSLKEKEVFHILSQLLNYHYDLVFFIININKKEEFLKSMDFHIEKDFYNWLNFDIIFRNELKICTKWNIDIYCESRCIKYKDQPLKNLLSHFGLDEEYTRIKSLSECFYSDWWRTHLKKTPQWRNIHKEITK